MGASRLAMGANSGGPLAVLLYSETANAMDYDEARVIGLLREAERLGCPEAAGNLEVLRYNRGESSPVPVGSNAR